MYKRQLLLCVIVAGASALSMVVFALAGWHLQHVVDRLWFGIGVALLSILAEVPAFLGQMGSELGFLPVSYTHLQVLSNVVTT